MMTVNEVITAVRAATSREDIASKLTQYTKPLISEASQAMYRRNIPMSWTKAKMISAMVGYESETRGTADFIAPQSDVEQTEPEPLMGFNGYSPEHLLHIKDKFFDGKGVGQEYMGYFYEMYARKVKVTGGRQAPKGTTGVCFWMGGIRYDRPKLIEGIETNIDCRVGIKSADGQVYWTYLRHIELATAKPEEKARSEYEQVVKDLKREGMRPSIYDTNYKTFAILKASSFDTIRRLNEDENLGVIEIDDAKDAKELEDFYRMDVEQEIHIRREKIRDAMIRGTLSNLEVKGGAIT